MISLQSYRSALSLCPASSSSCPDHPDLLLSLGSTLHALGDLAAASKVYALCQRYLPSFYSSTRSPSHDVKISFSP